MITPRGMAMSAATEYPMITRTRLTSTLLAREPMLMRSSVG